MRSSASSKGVPVGMPISARMASKSSSCETRVPSRSKTTPRIFIKALIFAQSGKSRISGLTYRQSRADERARVPCRFAPRGEKPMKRLGFRLARWGIAGLPCLGLACAQVPNNDLRSPPVPAAYPASPGPAADSSFNVRLSPEPVAHDANHRQALTVSLDAVMQLADEKNPQIAVARAKVASAFAEKELATKNWIPDIYIGVGYWRHEGGIQLQQGPLITSSTGAFEAGPQINATYNPRDRAYKQLMAARQVWQSHG